MKILCCPKSSSNIFPVILICMQLSRSLDCYICYAVTVLGMTLKELLSLCFQYSSFLVGKT